ncbi:hypothetical protein ACSSS7_001690 [Eimeria intestinalis]
MAVHKREAASASSAVSGGQSNSNITNNSNTKNNNNNNNNINNNNINDGSMMISSCSSSSSSSSSCRVSAALFYGSFLCLFFVMGISAIYPLPVLLQMLLYTSPILYVGSHLSLKQNEVDAVTGEKINKGEAMNRTDAFLFPVFGSIALFSLYLAYKFLSPAWVNMLLTIYLSGVGLVALGETIVSVARPLSPPSLCVESVFTFRLPYVLRLLRRYCMGSTPQKQHHQHQQQNQREQQHQEEQEGEGNEGDTPRFVEEKQNKQHHQHQEQQHEQQQHQEQKQHQEQQHQQHQEQEEDDDGVLTFGLSPLFVVSHLVALMVCGLWLITKNWALHNLLAIAFCIQHLLLFAAAAFSQHPCAYAAR